MTRVSRIRTAACAAAAIVAAVLIGTGWRDHQRLATAREENTRLAATARSLGIPVDEGKQVAFATTPARQATRHQLREDATAQDDRLRDFASRVAAMLAELEALSRDGQPGDADFQKRLHGLIFELQGMSPDDLRALVAIFQTHPDIEGEHRVNLAMFTLRTLADRHPQAALELALDAASPLRDIVGHALERWAADNPAAALRWFEQHPKLHHAEEGDNSRTQLVAGVARTDPARAFELIDQLGVKKLSAAGNMIASRGGVDDAGRNNVLAALRAHLAKSPAATEAAALRDNVIAGLASGANQNDSATAAIQWLDGADLAPEELEAVASRSTLLASAGNRAEWLDWFASLEAPKARDNGVRSVLHLWTTQDPSAAEAWTHQQPPGPARDTAHEVLAVTIMKHDPARAMHHAEQLPPGMSRGVNIQLILDEWQARDPDAATAYANEHGLDL